MSKESTQKEIDYHIHVKNNLWTAFLLTLGGTISQMVTFNNFFKIIPIIIGIIVSFLLLTGCLNKEELILKLIKKLEKE